MSEYVRARSHAAEVAKAHASRIAAGNAARLAAARLLPCLARSAGDSARVVVPRSDGPGRSAETCASGSAAQGGVPPGSNLQEREELQGR